MRLRYACIRVGSRWLYPVSQASIPVSANPIIVFAKVAALVRTVKGSASNMAATATVESVFARSVLVNMKNGCVSSQPSLHLSAPHVTRRDRRALIANPGCVFAVRVFASNFRSRLQLSIRNVPGHHRLQKSDQLPKSPKKMDPAIFAMLRAPTLFSVRVTTSETLATFECVHARRAPAYTDELFAADAMHETGRLGVLYVNCLDRASWGNSVVCVGLVMSITVKLRAVTTVASAATMLWLARARVISDPAVNGFASANLAQDFTTVLFVNCVIDGNGGSNASCARQRMLGEKKPPMDVFVVNVTRYCRSIVTVVNTRVIIATIIATALQ